MLWISLATKNKSLCKEAWDLMTSNQEQRVLSLLDAANVCFECSHIISKTVKLISNPILVQKRNKQRVVGDDLDLFSSFVWRIWKEDKEAIYVKCTASVVAMET